MAPTVTDMGQVKALNPITPMMDANITLVQDPALVPAQAQVPVPVLFPAPVPVLFPAPVPARFPLPVPAQVPALDSPSAVPSNCPIGLEPCFTHYSIHRLVLYPPHPPHFRPYGWNRTSPLKLQSLHRIANNSSSCMGVPDIDASMPALYSRKLSGGIMVFRHKGQFVRFCCMQLMKQCT